MKASEKYKLNKWTTVDFRHCDDGSVVVTIYDPNSQGKKHISFRAINLNKIDEEIIEDEEE